MKKEISNILYTKIYAEHDDQLLNIKTEMSSPNNSEWVDLGSEASAAIDHRKSSSSDGNAGRRSGSSSSSEVEFSAKLEMANGFPLFARTVLEAKTGSDSCREYNRTAG